MPPELLLFKIRLPVPETPPDIVMILLMLVLLDVRVVPLLFTVKAVVLTVIAEVELLCIISVTFEPTPPLIVTAPVPLPELVIVPVLLTETIPMPAPTELLT